MPFTVADLTRATITLVLCTVCVAWSASAPAATQHVTPAGILTGASDVNVNGTLYDVAFVDGSCATLFSPFCLFESAFTFPTFADAEAAAQALLDQVFLNVSAGRFDTHPELTNGCGDPIVCSAFIPFANLVEEHAVTVFTRTAHNSSEAPGNFIDVTGGNTFSATFDTTNDPERVWALFTSRQLFAVPEASTGLLLLMGSIAATGARRLRSRRRAASSSAVPARTSRSPRGR